MRSFSIFIICFFIAVAAGAQGIAVAPARMFFSGVSGQTLTQQLALSNTGKAPIVLKSSFKEWIRDSLGNKVYYDSGTLHHSNIAWMRVMPETVELAPGAKKEVTVIMQIPNNSEARDFVTNCMLFFTQINEQKSMTKSPDGANIGIIIKLEAGIHIYHTPPTFSKKNAEFTAFEDRGLVKEGADSVRRLALKVKNTGEIVLDGQIRFEVTDKETGEELKFPARAISMLPGAMQIVYLDLPATMEGRHYLAVGLLDIGSETNLKVAEKEISYKH